MRKPFSCQRTTVSGVTTRRACFHPDQNRRTTTQKSLSNGPRPGRGRRRFSTASCWRNARFSRRRPRRARKRRASVPKQSLTKGTTRNFLERSLLSRHHIDSGIQRMFGAAQQNAMDGTDVAIITPPCHRDVTVRGHAIVRWIKIHPPGAWAPSRAPGV